MNIKKYMEQCHSLSFTNGGWDGATAFSACFSEPFYIFDWHSEPRFKDYSESCQLQSGHVERGSLVTENRYEIALRRRPALARGVRVRHLLALPTFPSSSARVSRFAKLIRAQPAICSNKTVTLLVFHNRERF